MRSAIYEGQVTHERVRPKRHRLRYGVFSMLLDLDELPDLDRRHRLFGYDRWAPFSFFDRDHGPADGTPLRPWVERQLVDAGIDDSIASIRLLCYPRIFGYVFNPLSVYFCYGPSETLVAILYEVCNTFRERHTYVIPVVDDTRPVIRQCCDKSLYVSPFIGMDSRYHFRIVQPDERVAITIRQEDEDGLLLAAAFNGQRRAFSASELTRLLILFPLMTLKIVAGIHWEAVRLWLKGTPVFRHLPAERQVSTSIVHPPTTGA